VNVASLCAGIGGADLALESHGHRIAWHAEIDPAPSKVLAAHWPDVPNHGDLTAIDWATVEPVNIITAGYPCQPFSTAGQRKGTNDERHLWPTIRDAIESLRPRHVFLENVVGHLSLGAAIVVSDLAALGYVGAWGVLGSSDVGGCHRRRRFWLLAADANCGTLGTEPLSLGWGGGAVVARHDAAAARGGVDLLPTPAAADGSGGRRARNLEWSGNTAYRPSGAKASVSLQEAMDLLPTPRTSDTNGAGAHGDGGPDLRTAVADRFHPGGAMNWGRYHRAVDRWAGIFGQPPAPTDDKGRLNPPFVEWMLGYPAGWVTGHGLSRTQELRALGNSQQPQVAALAFARLAERLQAMTIEEAA